HGFLPAAVRAGAGAHLGWRAYQPAPQPWHEDVAGDARAVSPRDGGRRRDPRRTGVVSRSAVRVAQGLDRPDTGPHDVRVERPRPRPRPRWRRTDRPLRVRRLPLCRTARCQPLDPRGAPHGAGRGDHRPPSAAVAPNRPAATCPPTTALSNCPVSATGSPRSAPRSWPRRSSPALGAERQNGGGASSGGVPGRGGGGPDGGGPDVGGWAEG